VELVVSKRLITWYITTKLFLRFLPQLLANLTSHELAQSIAKKINDSQTFNSSEFYGASSEIQIRDEHGTAHTSVLHGNDAVSVTSSINF